MLSALTNMLMTLSRGVPGLVVAGLAMFLMLLALIKRIPSLMILASFLILPFAYAMGAWSGLLLFVRLLPLFPLLSALALSMDEPFFAWILPVIPFIYLVYLVFNLIVSDFRG